MHKTFLRLPSQDYHISIKISLWKEKWYYVNSQSEKPRDIELWAKRDERIYRGAK